MSATADTARYKDYFRDLGRGERVEVLAIPTSTERCLFQSKVFYLEQVVFHKLLNHIIWELRDNTNTQAALS